MNVEYYTKKLTAQSERSASYNLQRGALKQLEVEQPQFRGQLPPNREFVECRMNRCMSCQTQLVICVCSPTCNFQLFQFVERFCDSVGEQGSDIIDQPYGSAGVSGQMVFDGRRDEVVTVVRAVFHDGNLLVVL